VLFRSDSNMLNLRVDFSQTIQLLEKQTGKQIGRIGFRRNGSRPTVDLDFPASIEIRRVSDPSIDARMPTANR